MATGVEEEKLWIFGMSVQHIIERRTDSSMYLKIVKKIMLKTVKYLQINRCWIFQHDNDPKHTLMEMREWVKAKKIRILEWLNHFHDINPTEKLWKEFEIVLIGGISKIWAISRWLLNSLLGLQNTLTASLQMGKTHSRWQVSWIWH